MASAGVRRPRGKTAAKKVEEDGALHTLFDARAERIMVDELVARDEVEIRHVDVTTVKGPNNRLVEALIALLPRPEEELALGARIYRSESLRVRVRVLDGLHPFRYYVYQCLKDNQVVEREKCKRPEDSTFLRIENDGGLGGVVRALADSRDEFAQVRLKA
jgi:hypothetical protein